MFSVRNPGLLALLRRSSKKRKSQLGIASCLVVASGIAELSVTLLVYPFLLIFTGGSSGGLTPALRLIYDNNQNWIILKPLESITLILVGCIIATCSLRTYNLWYCTRLAANIGNDLSTEALINTMNLPFEKVTGRNSAEYISIIGVQSDYTIYALKSLFQMISAAFTSILIVIGLIIINPLFTVFSSIGVAGLYIVVGLNAKRKLSINSINISARLEQQQKILRDGFMLIRDIILDSMQEDYAQEFDKNNKSLRRNQSQNEFIAAFPKFIIETVCITSILLYMLFQSLGSQSNNVVLPFIGTLALASQRLLPSIQQIYGQWAQIRSMNESVKSLLRLVESGNKVVGVNKELGSSYRLKDRIVLHAVTFGYRSQAAVVLKNVNMEIRKGEITAIVGVSGSGKSTLVDIILGLLKPREGFIEADGINISRKEFTRQYDWRKSCSHVPQSIYLADNTLAYNISLGGQSSYIIEDKLDEAAKNACIYDFIERVPGKYSMRVGENGSHMSGGQKQRIGLARAFFKKSSILVIDEGTSALDSDTEKRIISYLHETRIERAALIITHNERLLEYCDRVYRISNGQVFRER